MDDTIVFEHATIHNCYWLYNSGRRSEVANEVLILFGSFPEIRCESVSGVLWNMDSTAHWTKS